MGIYFASFLIDASLYKNSGKKTPSSAKVFASAKTFADGVFSSGDELPLLALFFNIFPNCFHGCIPYRAAKIAITPKGFLFPK